ncbi:DNA-3-methyladenine glycosylase family protein [Staphylospora marina]|uniref:DNA-3-methyladenine glycosylase family protein n=1 Tax=Staphylospora marina TaxID=2490858 RepID=UPI000F5BE8AD|nr:DNA-3-methyladenine glycosylase [Staphylospora marina]
MRFTLKPDVPYSFEKTVRRLKQFEKTMWVRKEDALARAIRGKRGPLLVTVRNAADDAGLVAEVSGPVADGEEELLKKLVARMFGLDVDLTPFYEKLDDHPVLGPVIRERHGLQIVQDPTVYECLVKTVISQQLNLSFAGTLVRRLVERAGEHLEIGGETFPVFPSPEQVARLQPKDLQALQFNRRKAEYVIDISRMVTDGKLDLEGLRDLPDGEVFERLLPIRGVGRWTVECVLLFGLGRPDLLPAADIGLRNALRKLYGMDAQPDEQTVRRLGEEWAPFRSHATCYLWDSLG